MRIRTLFIALTFALMSKGALALTVIPAGDEVQYAFTSKGIDFTVDSAGYLKDAIVTPATCTGCGAIDKALFVKLGPLSDTVTVGGKIFAFAANAFDTVGSFSSLLPKNRATLDVSFVSIPDPPTGVPEPSVWALLILGFGALGLQLRRLRQNNAAAC